MRSYSDNWRTTKAKDLEAGIYHVGDALSTPSRDRDDWMFDSVLFEFYAEKLGPYSYDMCAAIDGSNAQLPNYWTKERSCMDQDWRNENLWCNPPWDLLPDIITKYATYVEEELEAGLPQRAPNYPGGTELDLGTLVPSTHALL